MDGRRYGRISDDKRSRVVHLLKTTTMSFEEIARRVAIHQSSVSSINKKSGARPTSGKRGGDHNKFWEDY